jgi:sulfur carrier protein
MRPQSTLQRTWRDFAPLLLAWRMSLDGSLGIRVNGEHRRVPGGISIAEMVNSLGLDPLRVAVERNLEIVPRSTLGEVCVEDGDDFEIVHFVGGG